MKSGFKDPIAVKKQDPKYKPQDGKNSPWNYSSPQYDQRSSCFVNVGTHYGVGHKQPVGKFEAKNTGAIPYGRIDTMKVDEVG